MDGLLFLSAQLERWATLLPGWIGCGTLGFQLPSRGEHFKPLKPPQTPPPGASLLLGRNGRDSIYILFSDQPSSLRSTNSSCCRAERRGAVVWFGPAELLTSPRQQNFFQLFFFFNAALNIFTLSPWLSLLFTFVFILAAASRWNEICRWQFILGAVTRLIDESISLSSSRRWNYGCTADVCVIIITAAWPSQPAA